MGLAPYGVPIYEDKIKDNLIEVKEDGSFHLDQSYFNYATGLTMTNKNLITYLVKKLEILNVKN